MIYNVISTGSKGNAVVLDGRILIDCGVPYYALKSVLMDLQLVILTHQHGDHMNHSTIRRLALERPTLRFGCPDYLVGDLREDVEPGRIDVLTAGSSYNYGAYIISPFTLRHNVPNVGYRIGGRGWKAIYATDTNTLDGVEAPEYDLYMIEANYDEDEIAERIRRKQEAGEHIYEWDVLENHLSREKALDFIYRNIGNGGQYVLLHQHEDG